MKVTLLKHTVYQCNLIETDSKDKSLNWC